MKNFLRVLAAFVLAYILAIFRSVTVSAWMWLPMLMDHWFGIIIGVVVCFGGEILYYKFIGDN